MKMKKHDKTQDQISTRMDIQITNTINDLRGLNPKNKETVLKGSCNSTELYEVANSLKIDEERQKKEKEDLEKRLKKPMEEYDRCKKIVKETENKFMTTKDSELLEIVEQLENQKIECEKSYEKVYSIDPSIPPPSFDHAPKDASSKLTWASRMRQLWTDKKEGRFK